MIFFDELDSRGVRSDMPTIQKTFLETYRKKYFIYTYIGKLRL